MCGFGVAQVMDCGVRGDEDSLARADNSFIDKGNALTRVLTCVSSCG